MAEGFIDYLKKFIDQNKRFLFLLAGACVLSYGFSITHYSIGIDTTRTQYYITDLGLVGQGRLTGILIDRLLFPLGQIPFWSLSVGIMFLYCAVVLLAMLFTRILKDRVNQNALTIFGTVMVSYPMLNETYIYGHIGYNINFLLTALVLYSLYDLLSGFSIKKAILPAIIMVFSISYNESYCAVVLVGTFIILILQLISAEGEKLSLKKAFLFFVAVLGILVAAIIAEKVVEKAAILVLHPQSLGGANNDMEWQQYGILGAAKLLSIGIIYRYILSAYWYFPTAALCVSALIIVVVSIYLAIGKKRPIALLLAAGLLLSVISLSLIKGHVAHYRMCTAFAPFIGFTAMLVYLLLNKKWMRIIYGVLMIVLVVNQTRALNNWFVNDYLRYENDKEIALQTAKDLERDFDTSKPVVFVGNTAMAPQVNKVATNGLPIIGWATITGQSDEQMHIFMLMHGHEFVEGTQSMIDNGRMLAENQAVYPKEGYIVDYDDFIVVNYGNEYKWRLLDKEKAVKEWYTNTLTALTGMDRDYVAGQIETAINQ